MVLTTRQLTKHMAVLVVVKKVDVVDPNQQTTTKVVGAVAKSLVMLDPTHLATMPMVAH